MTLRVEATTEAIALIDRLTEQHGPLLFHQSGGCCDGSSPMCYPDGDFVIGERDVFVGVVSEHAVPFYMGGDQFTVWEHTHITLDVVKGRGSGFSLEAPEGVRFLIRSRLFTEEEAASLAAAGPVPRGPQLRATPSSGGVEAMNDGR